ncbi:conjugative transfer system coupling protein TraD [Marinobacter sp. P4B1]|uniref:conjugative transfer system coupling protein TraD n=1 Tax=Marinobacter sp. P4B1 TaxID=1119533 RepID=UPI001D0CEC60|nr:conjugative transfer system coupling protein TraD [Marinobacter sp. P4B1]
MSNPDYEMPWRPPFEAYSMLAWIASTGVCFAIAHYGSLPSGPFYYVSAFALCMAVFQGVQAYKHMKVKRNLCGKELTFMDIEDLYKKVTKPGAKFNENLWIGKGFEWGQKHAQRVYEITKRSMEEDIDKQVVKKFGAEKAKKMMGKPWIHGVEPNEQDLVIPTDHLSLHTVVFGTTGAGKTRLLDLIVSQAIFRNEAVIIIDPKGDKELMLNAFRACKIAGKPEAFMTFNPAYPEQSVRIDPMKNWNRSTELASRVKDLIVSDADNDPFAQFSWMAINNIVQGLIETGTRPNFRRLRQYIEGGPAKLLARALANHFDDCVPNWRTALASKLQKAKDGEAETRILVSFYVNHVQEKHRKQSLDGLCKMFQHEKSHFSKMVASLEPILNQLTSGELGDLLSPDEEDIHDIRPITDSSRIINSGQVVVVGLDSLSDSTVGSAIGSIFLADLTAVAGDRYNYPVSNRPINVIVDEASEVINKPLIQLMNKGRGAGFRVTICSQAYPDFIARMGDESKARQVIANANNLIGLRTKDDQTQEFISAPMGDTIIRQIMHTQNTNAIDNANPTSFSGGYGERLIETEMPLFPPALLGNLPNLEYIASFSGGRIRKGRLPIIQSNIEVSLDDQVWMTEREI